MTVHHLSRRSALRGFGVTVAGGVVGYVVSRNSNAASAKSLGTAANGYGSAPKTGGRELATLDQVPEGGGLILGDEHIVLTHSADGSVHAFSSICTHQGCPVNSVSGGTINCPCHGSKFDVNTGAVVAGPAPSPLASISVTVRDNGIYTA